MLKPILLQPDLILGGSIINLSPDLLLHYQLKGLVLDVDETLVPLSETEVSPQLHQWIAQMKQLADLWLVSNNLSENRIGRIAQSLDVPYFTGATKPSRRKLRQAIAAMNLPPAQVAMVGDRIITDVLAGNRLGMFTILVEPMVEPAIAARSYSLRNFEVWFSQLLGVSLKTSLPTITQPDKTL